MPVRVIDVRSVRRRRLLLRIDGDASVYIYRKVEELIRRISARMLEKGEESLGLLYGSFVETEGREITLVTYAEQLPSKGSSHRVSVDYLSDFHSDTPQSFQVVGWFHSHTGAGNFMSETDIGTHMRWFGQRSVSLIYEAVEGTLKAYTVVDGKVKELLMSKM